jgi:putative 4-mercaptohistidine N1-methyltranferase
MLRGNVYESRGSLDEYLLFHYGLKDQILTSGWGPSEALDFPMRCVELLGKNLPSRSSLRALDLGCAVGRASFELSRFCAEVVGIDFSSSFIRAAEEIRNTGSIQCERREEGDVSSPVKLLRPSAVHPDRVRFKQGDACALEPDIGVFDGLLAANLIDRLGDPERFLRSTPGLVRDGGVLVITSPYTWMEEFTPRARWLGGYRNEAGEIVESCRTLEKLLSPHFELVEKADLPFLIREHARKFQWSVAEATVWKRRG